MVYGVIGLYTSATFDWNASNWKLGQKWKPEYWTQETELTIEIMKLEVHGPTLEEF